MKLQMLSEQDKVSEIRRLYFTTTKQTIQDDLARALDLLKSMPGEAERERVAVYMEGLAQMRSDWYSQGGASTKGQGRRKKKKKSSKGEVGRGK